MAATIVVTCPHCKKQLKAPAEAEGKKIRCKNCGSAFPVRPSAQVKSKPSAPAAKPKPPAPAAKQEPAKGTDGPPSGLFTFKDEDYDPTKEVETQKKEAKAAQAAQPGFEADNDPYAVTDLDLAARCPHCAKLMENETAVICLHCGYNTQTRTHVEVERTYVNTGFDQFMWMLPGILCLLGIGLSVAFDVWFWFGLEDTWKEWDENVKGLSLGVRIWIIIMSLFAMWKLGRFAFLRLVINYKRPERKKAN